MSAASWSGAAGVAEAVSSAPAPRVSAAPPTTASAIATSASSASCVRRSIRRRSVTSRQMQTPPPIRPAWSRSGAPVTPSRISRPSRVRTIETPTPLGIDDALDGEDVVPGFTYPIARLFP